MVVLREQAWNPFARNDPTARLAPADRTHTAQDLLNASSRYALNAPFSDPELARGGRGGPRSPSPPRRTERAERLGGGFFDDVGAAGGAGDEPGEGAAVAVLVVAGQALADVGDAVARRQRDRAAAEAAAGHARAENAARLADVVREVDQRIELRRADLEIVTQRTVAFVHESAGRAPLAGGQRVRSRARARVFGHDVARAPVEQRSQRL